MTISDTTDRFAGRAVTPYVPGQVPSLDTAQVYRLELEHDATGTMAELLQDFVGRLSPADRTQLEALVIGRWDEPWDTSAEALLAALVELAPQLPGLKALFVGDMTYEDCEISWILQGSYNALLAAYPGLEVLRIRGGNGLTLNAFSHASLRELVIECGGLDREILRALGQSQLPALDHLELWLGTDEYGFNGALDDVQTAIDHLRSPALRTLALKDAEIADEVAVWLAGQAWVAELHTLDLSLGTLSDAGAQALLESPHIRNLQVLNLSHHYISPAVQDALRALPLTVVLDDPQEEDDGYRYVAVGE